MNRNLRQQSKVLKEPAGKSVASIDVNGAAVDGDLFGPPSNHRVPNRPCHPAASLSVSSGRGLERGPNFPPGHGNDGAAAVSPMVIL